MSEYSVRGSGIRVDLGQGRRLSKSKSALGPVSGFDYNHLSCIGVDDAFVSVYADGRRELRNLELQLQSLRTDTSKMRTHVSAISPMTI